MVLDLRSRRVGETVVLELTGELDISEAARVERELRHVESGEPEELVFDLRNLEFMDSTGLRLIVAAYQRLAVDGRRVRIVRGPPPVQRIFAVTRLEERFEFIDSPPDGDPVTAVP